MELWQCFWMCEKLDQDENFTTFGFWKYIYCMWCTHQNLCGKGLTLLSPQLHDSDWDGNSHCGLLSWQHTTFQVGTNVMEQNTPSISLRMKAVYFSKWEYPPLRLQGVRTQNITTWIFMTTKTSNLREESMIISQNGNDGWRSIHSLLWGMILAGVTHFKSINLQLEMFCHRTIA